MSGAVIVSDCDRTRRDRSKADFAVEWKDDLPTLSPLTLLGDCSAFGRAGYGEKESFAGETDEDGGGSRGSDKKGIVTGELPSRARGDSSRCSASDIVGLCARTCPGMDSAAPGDPPMLLSRGLLKLAESCERKFVTKRVCSGDK